MLLQMDGQMKTKTIILFLILSSFCFAQLHLGVIARKNATRPDAPTNIVTTDNDNLEFTVTWTEADTPDSIAIFGGTSTAPTTALDTIAGAVETYNYTTITDEAYWYVRVKSKKDGVWSDYSVEDTATVDSTNLVPSASSDFTTDGTGWWTSAAVTKSWDASGFMQFSYSDGSAAALFYHSFTTGLKYYLSLKIRASDDTNNPAVYNGAAYVPLDGGNTAPTYKTFSLVFTLGGGYGNITIQPIGNFALNEGRTIDLDDIIIARTP